MRGRPRRRERDRSAGFAIAGPGPVTVVPGQTRRRERFRTNAADDVTDSPRRSGTGAAPRDRRHGTRRCRREGGGPVRPGAGEVGPARRPRTCACGRRCTPLTAWCWPTTGSGSTRDNHPDGVALGGAGRNEVGGGGNAPPVPVRNASLTLLMSQAPDTRVSSRCPMSPMSAIALSGAENAIWPTCTPRSSFLPVGPSDRERSVTASRQSRTDWRVAN